MLVSAGVWGSPPQTAWSWERPCPEPPGSPSQTLLKNSNAMKHPAEEEELKMLRWATFCNSCILCISGRILELWHTSWNSKSICHSTGITHIPYSVLWYFYKVDRVRLFRAPLPESRWGRGVAERLEAWAALRQHEEKKSWTWRDSSLRHEPSWSPCSMECTTRGSTRWQKSALTWGGHAATQDFN